MMGATKNWNSLYMEKRIIQKEPSKRSIESADLFKRERLKRILDLGCGTGRHLIYLLKQGFDIYGCDSSENALILLKERLEKERLKEVQLTQCDMTSLLYESAFFDGIVCTHVIQHGRLAEIKKAISEIYRVLRKSGIILLTIPSVKHWKALSGEQIEPNTRINIEAPDGDMPHHFFSEEEIKELFKDFEIIKLNHYEEPSEFEPDKMTRSWEILAKKLK